MIEDAEITIKKSKKYLIYKHTCVVSGKFYIGYTSRSIEKRWKEHLYSAHSENYIGYNTHFYQAIRKYENEKYVNNYIEIWTHEILEDNIQTLQEAKIAENKWIIELKSNVNKIGYNSTTGGDGPEMNQEVRDKISKSNKGRKASPETLAKMSAFQKGRPKSEEHKEKIRQARIGKSISVEGLEKLRASKKRPEYIEKMRLINTGRKVSDETKAKISASNKGRVTSEETKEKRHITISTPEYKEKIRSGRMERKRKVPKETKEKISKSMKEKIENSEEYREKVYKIFESGRSACRTEEAVKNHLLAVRTPENREQARQKRLGKKMSDETKAKMKIIQNSPEIIEKKRLTRLETKRKKEQNEKLIKDSLK